MWSLNRLFPVVNVSAWCRPWHLSGPYDNRLLVSALHAIGIERMSLRSYWVSGSRLRMLYIMSPPVFLLYPLLSGLEDQVSQVLPGLEHHQVGHTCRYDDKVAHV